MKKADRMREVEDPDNVVLEKCKKLASYLRNSKCTLVYTGAGISTAASIPDYRGPNGVWTLAEKGIAHSKCGDPIECCPTTSHMVLKEFCRRGIIRHILSQNCDGLHLRSGLPQKMLSEIHGNMHIEVCTHCDPPRQFIRPFDVTQKSQFRRHGTGRACTVCNTELVDTIVHFGEVGRVPWPLNWKGVTSLIDECDLIVCVGTSLAVLKQYQFLWPKAKGQTQIAIVNLQWTPKDRSACLKINARCDTVFEKLAKLFSVPVSYYCRDCDPVLNPRRNARICELMERITDCRCHLRVPRSTCDEQGPRGTPGWWAVGIQRTMKRSLQTPSNQKKRSVGRPRKRKKSCAVSRGVSPDEEVVVEKNNSSDTKFSSYNESTAVICAISELDMRSVHGSHLNQFLNASAEGVVESDGGNRLEVKVGESDEELIVGCKVEWKSVKSCLTALIDEVSALQ
ncbi:unnamed protein product [Anisakis simplex]|uniref:protein acetyllysine N-acetyltransferase n=1 Tax=Anisakis simplex TaxID=6269 RepID=A0A0M3IYC5_ANISI|nr:unnamed protein product [Anisakis simplex]